MLSRETVALGATCQVKSRSLAEITASKRFPLLPRRISLDFQEFYWLFQATLFLRETISYKILNISEQLLEAIGKHCVVQW